MRSKFRYYLPVLRSLAQKTNLKLAGDEYVVESPFIFTEDAKKQWHDLFDVGAEVAMPLPYELSAMTPPVIRILRGVGANFKNVRQVRTLIKYDPELPPVRPDDSYRVRAKLDDVVALGSDSIIAVIGIDLLDDDVTRVSHQAYFMVAKVAPRDMSRLRADTTLHRTDLASLDLTRRTNESLEPLREPVSMVTFTIPPRMGVRFARVSGDYNFVHIYNATARMLGFPKAFIQGSAITAYAVRYLCELSPKPLEFLDVTFVRPIFVGETVEMRCGAGKFWMSDSHGAIMAHGTWT